ncbi:hypothetical protein QR77_16535 [Streptomyces sp. 150FB]|nr:hypothetical protein QR77_16535 [Streptomyces sp. 150FB]
MAAGVFLVQGAQGDATAEGGKVVAASGVEVVGALDAGLDADDLGVGGAAQAFEPVLDGVHA